MRVLVTGDTGFIGQALIRRLMREKEVTVLMGGSLSHKTSAFARPLDEKFTFHEIHMDILDRWHLRTIMPALSPDVIFHLAGKATVRERVGFPHETFDLNVTGTENLLAYAPEGCRFVLASSSTVYGNNPGGFGGHGCSPLDYLEPNSIYGASKVAAEAIMDAYTQLNKVSGISLRLVANVGMGATHGLLKDLITKVGSPSETLDLIGDEPGSSKQYMHVRDTADAFVKFGLNMPFKGALNVCTSDSLSVKQVAEIVMEVMGKHKPIKWLGESANWAGDNRNVKLSHTFTNMYWKPEFSSSAVAVAQAVSDFGVAAL